jgi:hypothetical protein
MVILEELVIPFPEPVICTQIFYQLKLDTKFAEFTLLISSDFNSWEAYIPTFISFNSKAVHNNFS